MFLETLISKLKKPQSDTGVPSVARLKANVEIGHECIQGARFYNEDMLFISDTNDKFQVYGILDGHAGLHAANVLKGLMHISFDNAKYTLLKESPINKATILDFVCSIYEDANQLLRFEKSGVVSLLAIMFQDSVYMVWVGDCEACLMQAGRYQNPILQSTEASIIEYDFALSDKPKPTKRSRACSRPHSLGTSVVPNYFAMWNYPMYRDVNMFCYQELYSSALYTFPEGFDNSDALLEYNTMKEKGFGIPTVDITRVKIGNNTKVVDCRFSNSIQPTRSLGDDIPDNKYILRKCSALVLDLSNIAHKHTISCILCTDGCFHNGAFKDMQRLSQFFSDPLLFFRQYFYHSDQDTSIRLITCNYLPCALDSEEEKAKRLLSNSWASMGDSWENMSNFLLNHHMIAIQSSLFKNTFNELAISDYETWINACNISCNWISSQTGIQYTNRKWLASMACHLAVLMGSRDNISVMYVPCTI